MAPLFWLFVALHVVPAWLWPHFPSQDGPGHVLHSYLLLHLDEVPAWHEHYVRNVQPMPNWIGYVLLCGLMQFLAPAAAEKALVSIYVLSFCLAARACTRAFEPRPTWAAFLVFPFVHAFPLHVGLYNFVLGVPVCLLAIAAFWRRRAAPGWRGVVVVNAWLILAYFAHFAAFGIAAIVIGALALASVPRASWRWALGLAPSLVMPVWFVLRQPHLEGRGGWSNLRESLANFGGIISSDEQKPLAVGLWLLCGAAFATSVYVRRRARTGWTAKDALLVPITLLAVMYLLLPDDTSSGGLVKLRIGMFTFLLLVPWLEPLVGRLRAGFAVAAIALAAACLVTSVRYQASASVDLEEYLSGLPSVEPGATLLPHLFSTPPPAVPRPDVGRRAPTSIAHATDWYALERRCANLLNFHAQHENFPILFRHRSDHGPRVVHAFATADYALVWGATPELAATIPSAFPQFREVFHSTGGRLQVFKRE